MTGRTSYERPRRPRCWMPGARSRVQSLLGLRHICQAAQAISEYVEKSGIAIILGGFAMLAMLLVLALGLFQIPATAAQKSENISQLRAEVERLKTIEKKLAAEFSKTQTELTSVRKEIEALESKIAESSLDSVEFVETKVQMRCTLFSIPNGFYGIGFLRANSSVRIYGYEMPGKFYKIKSKDGFAYIRDDAVKDTPLLAAMRQSVIARYEQEERASKAELENKMRVEIEKAGKAEEARKASLVARFGIYVSRILNHQFWIGMTDEMARASLGSPEAINRTVTASAVHEQWVYITLYLYFEDGILTSYQDRR